MCLLIAYDLRLLYNLLREVSGSLSSDGIVATFSLHLILSSILLNFHHIVLMLHLHHHVVFLFEVGSIRAVCI
jgi:hypothetical protein